MNMEQHIYQPKYFLFFLLPTIKKTTHIFDPGDINEMWREEPSKRPHENGRSVQVEPLNHGMWRRRTGVVIIFQCLGFVELGGWLVGWLRLVGWRLVEVDLLGGGFLEVEKPRHQQKWVKWRERERESTHFSFEGSSYLFECCPRFFLIRVNICAIFCWIPQICKVRDERVPKPPTDFPRWWVSDTNINNIAHRTIQVACEQFDCEYQVNDFKTAPWAKPSCKRFAWHKNSGVFFLGLTSRGHQMGPNLEGDQTWLQIYGKFEEFPLNSALFGLEI